MEDFSIGTIGDRPTDAGQRMHPQVNRYSFLCPVTVNLDVSRAVYHGHPNRVRVKSNVPRC